MGIFVDISNLILLPKQGLTETSNLSRFVFPVPPHPTKMWRSFLPGFLLREISVSLYCMKFLIVILSNLNTAHRVFSSTSLRSMYPLYTSLTDTSFNKSKI
jgi:hypothetical protein